MPELTGYKALTFDCYGTLIDWESGIWDALQPLLLANGSEIDRDTALLAFAETPASGTFAAAPLFRDVRVRPSSRAPSSASPWKSS